MKLKKAMVGLVIMSLVMPLTGCFMSTNSESPNLLVSLKKTGTSPMSVYFNSYVKDMVHVSNHITLRKIETGGEVTGYEVLQERGKSEIVDADKVRFALVMYALRESKTSYARFDESYLPIAKMPKQEQIAKRLQSGKLVEDLKSYQPYTESDQKLLQLREEIIDEVKKDDEVFEQIFLKGETVTDRGYFRNFRLTVFDAKLMGEILDIDQIEKVFIKTVNNDEQKKELMTYVRQVEKEVNDKLKVISGVDIRSTRVSYFKDRTLNTLYYCSYDMEYDAFIQTIIQDNNLDEQEKRAAISILEEDREHTIFKEQGVTVLDY